jgi:alpha-L-fucosidase
MILTAKHHDGFCLWPTATTTHSVAASPWRGGSGDVVAEFVAACRDEALGAGLYLSPWDRHEPSYGDSPRYNDLYIAQLTELLTRYGRLVEVWFMARGRAERETATVRLAPRSAPFAACSRRP